jgi:uncharacterized protein (UPF0548 family)
METVEETARPMIRVHGAGALAIAERALGNIRTLKMQEKAERWGFGRRGVGRSKIRSRPDFKLQTHSESSDRFFQLVEIHAAPSWHWPALVSAMLAKGLEDSSRREPTARYRRTVLSYRRVDQGNEVRRTRMAFLSFIEGSMARLALPL